MEDLAKVSYRLRLRAMFPRYSPGQIIPCDDPKDAWDRIQCRRARQSARRARRSKILKTKKFQFKRW